MEKTDILLIAVVIISIVVLFSYYNKESFENNLVYDDSLQMPEDKEIELKDKMLTQNSATGEYKKASYAGGARGGMSENLDAFFEQGIPFTGNSNDSFTPKDESGGNLATYVANGKKIEDEDKFNATELLPVESNENWFDDVNVTGIKNKNLINIYRPVGVNTVQTSLKNPSHDVRGTPTNPRHFVSPWMMSSYEPDMNLHNLALCS